MRAEYYADEVNRYNLYARNYGDNKLYRIVAGPRADNPHWTEVLMRDVSMFIDGIGLHYYTRVGDPVYTKTLPDGNVRYLRDNSISRKSATDFNDFEWFKIMEASIYTDKLLTKHEAIMDKYDPEKRVAMIVDEWGTWYDCEPGTNPRFLYQQNTLRDAVSAGTSLNIFNNHCDRVRMANIAQTINVLQAMILTEDEKMILTPTYHVFDMYQVHHDARLLDFALVSNQYEYDGIKLNQINASVSKAQDGSVNMTICNIDHKSSADISCYIEDFDNFGRNISATILTAEKMNAMNTFDEPENLKPVCFDDFEVNGNKISIHMPAKSVLLMTVRP